MWDRTNVQSSPSAAARGGLAWRRNVWWPVYISLLLQLSLTLACIKAQCVAVCCKVLQCVAVVAGCYSMLQLSLTLACIKALSKTLPSIHGLSLVPVPCLTSTGSCRRRWRTLVWSHVEDFFQKSSGQILPLGSLREASPSGYARRWDMCRPGCVMWLSPVCDMTHAYVWHDSFICVTWLDHTRTPACVTRLLYVCDMTLVCVWHDSCICVTWLIHMCDMTHTYAWHDSFICVTHSCTCVTRLNHTNTCLYDMTPVCAWNDSCTCVTWLMHMCEITLAYVWPTLVYVWHDLFVYANTCLCDMNPVCVWRDSCICVIWLMHICDMTHSHVWMSHSCVWHGLFICVTGLIHMCDMIHAYVWHDSCICVTWLIHMCDMTHSYVWHDSIICVTWLNHMCDMTHAWCALFLRCVWHITHINDSKDHTYKWLKISDDSLIHDIGHDIGFMSHVNEHTH